MSSEAIGGGALETPVALLSPSCANVRYPESLRLAGIGGEAIVEFALDTMGVMEPLSDRVTWATHPGLHDWALQFVRSCRFRPGQSGGHPQRARGWLRLHTSVAHGDVSINVTSR